MLPLPTTARTDRGILSFLDGRSKKSLRLALILIAAISTLSWGYHKVQTRRSAHLLLPLVPSEAAVLYGDPDVPEPEVVGDVPQAHISDNLSTNAKEIRAFLNYVTSFPDRALPPDVISGDNPDIIANLADEAREAGVLNWHYESLEPPLVVFSKTYCPFSRAAKTLLASLHLEPAPVIVEADLRSDTSTLKSVLIHLTNHATFPNVFIGGESVGGSDDLKALYNNGRLTTLLKEAGVETKTEEFDLANWNQQ